MNTFNLLLQNTKLYIMANVDVISGKFITSWDGNRINIKL